VRDDKNLPFFPSDGSRYSLSYSKVGGFMGGDFDYSQWDSRVNWWFPVFRKLTLGVESQFGIILGENVQSYALYQMGGLLGYQGKLRGYEPGTVGGGRVGRSYLSFTTEFTYPVVENTFYLLAFFDAGNVFGRLPKYSSSGTGIYNQIPKESAPSALSEIDLADLRRDVGFGFRVVVPMVAPFGMGFDFGWPLDDPEDYNGNRYKSYSRAPKIQFTIEQGF
jgi:outer membrane protein insertion porin family